jgi:glycosyltransferase involved in cell wall biosynthesis
MIDILPVSIIVPVYNRAEKLPRLLKTIQNQSMPNWELILINDWSTDESLNVMEAAAGLDKRIVCVNNNHKKGPSGARNTGLDFATGKYIAYQDSDDEWASYHLEVMLDYLENYPQIDVMTANPLRKKEETGEVFNYDEIDLTKYEYKKIGDGYLIDGEKVFDYQLRGRIVTTQCLVGRAEILKSTRWNEDLSAAVDIMHNLKLCAKAVSVCHLHDYHAIYWAHSDNLTNVSGGHSPARMEKVHKSFALYWSTVLKEFPLNDSQRKFAKSEFSTTLAWHLGYHTYEGQKKYLSASACYARAILLDPSNAKYWSSFVKCFYKVIFKS